MSDFDLWKTSSREDDWDRPGRRRRDPEETEDEDYERERDQRTELENGS
mgnify:CR=1 FL=1